jgi:hypothetical protein
MHRRGVCPPPRGILSWKGGVCSGRERRPHTSLGRCRAARPRRRAIAVVAECRSRRVRPPEGPPHYRASPGSERARQPRAANPNRGRAAVLWSASQACATAAGGTAACTKPLAGTGSTPSRCQLLAAAPHRSRGVPLPEHRARSPVRARESSGDSEQLRATANSPEECVVHRTGE